MPPTKTSAPEDTEALLAEQVRQHAALAPLAIAGTAAAALVLISVLWDAFPSPHVLGWFALLLPPNLVRVVVTRAYHRAPFRAPLELWRRRFRTITIANGIAWGVTGLLVFPTGQIEHQTFLAFCLTGMAASSITVTSFDLVAGLSFLGLVIAPMALHVIIAPGVLSSTVGVMMLLFSVYMSVTARRAYRMLVESVRLRRAAAARAESLARFQAALAVLRGLRGSSAEFFSAALRETVATLGLSRAVLWLDDGDLGTLQQCGDAGPASGSPRYPQALDLAAMPRYAALAAQGTAIVRGLPASDAAFAELRAAAIDGGTGARIDVPLTVAGRLEGLLWCERNGGTPWSDDDEAFAGAVAAKILNTRHEARQREAEQQLREVNGRLEELVAERTRDLTHSEARLAQALDATNDGVWEIDFTSDTVYYSPVWARLLGYAPDEVAPKVETFWQAVHPDDVPRVQDVFTAHLAGRLPQKVVEVRLRRKSGDYRWFLDRGRVVARDADGTPVRMVGTISDITERKQALQDLHESEQRFRVLFDKSPMIVTLVDEDGRVLEINEAAVRDLGYPREEAIGRTTIDLGVWVDVKERERFVAELRKTGVVAGREVEFRRKDGQRFWGLMSSAQVHMYGAPYVLNIVLDVTERRELENRVRQAQKMEVVGHLAGGIAHDFNNLLTVITGTAELAMNDNGAGLHEALATIRDASARAATLTGQLMAFSRRQILQPVALDLNDVVTGLAPMLRRAVGALVTLETVPAPTPATLVADRGSLEQVILNLALNARDAMPDGGTLRLAVSHATIAAGGPDSLAPGRYVALTVTDSGTGMSEEVRRRVFEPFFTTKAAGKGTGLGLSMAHGFVTQSGGDIAVRSAPGAGTTFVIHLPAAAPVTRAEAEATGGPHVGHETILVVDDNREIREVVRRVLSFSGYQVLVAAHGEEALRQLREHDGDVALLLTDVIMPGLNGRELATRVRDLDPRIRVLFTSGYDDDQIARQGVLAKGVEFIAKPYSLQALTRKVRDVLDAPA